MKHGINLPLSRLRNTIREVRAGRVTLQRAKLIRTACNHWIELARLTLRAEQLGVDDRFFTMAADRSALRKFQKLLKELSNLIPDGRPYT